ncbi:DUF775-domain-containing protein [Saccharata proteae CBS 121410]|uniref:DUF775-domain-containing protein n=1 Tax=Saccharata proteae CBS 121410 TaxID=1314787 RepID=A0A9P4HMY9_9PEZI|nr:DUF775-domain-containing protein [Saccharata proteae CBS 121410]
MFGVIVSGRPVITDLPAVNETSVACQIPSSPPFNHIVVFLLPGQTIPAGTAASVYIQIPPSTDFQFLGAIANEKQSAIFKVNGVEAANQAVGAAATVTLGISLEPIAQVAQSMESKQNGGMQLVRAGPVTASPVTTKELAKRIIGNAFNFLASFAGNTSNGVEVVPLKSFQDWWTKFEKKVEMDPGFLERGDQA